MKVKFVLFDLDGTTVHTLVDLTRAINDTLKQFQLPTTDEQGVKNVLGSGAMEMVKGILKAVPYDEAFLKKFYSAYMVLYQRYQLDSSKPFPGIVALMEQLKKRGIKSYIFSNKPDAFAVQLMAKVMPGSFLDVQGQRPGAKAKPDVTELRAFCLRNTIDLASAIYVGDSPIDIQTADNLGVPSVGCSWGYVPLPVLNAAKPRFLIDEPLQLLAVINSLEKKS